MRAVGIQQRGKWRFMHNRQAYTRHRPGITLLVIVHSNTFVRRGLGVGSLARQGLAPLRNVTAASMTCKPNTDINIMVAVK